MLRLTARMLRLMLRLSSFGVTQNSAKLAHFGARTPCSRPSDGGFCPKTRNVLPLLRLILTYARARKKERKRRIREIPAGVGISRNSRNMADAAALFGTAPILATLSRDERGIWLQTEGRDRRNLPGGRKEVRA